jgi:hypothetical protein
MVMRNFTASITTVLDNDYFHEEFSNITRCISNPSVVYNKSALLWEISGSYEGDIDMDQSSDPDYPSKDAINQNISVPFEFNLNELEVN